MPNGRTVRTTERDATFFDEFARSANVSAACALAGYSRTSVYEWRNADVEFAKRWENAENDATVNLEAEMYRRAVMGVTQYEPMLYKGKLVHTREITTYSDTLAIFLAKARNPDKYRERIEMTVNWRQEARSMGLDPEQHLQAMIEHARAQLEANANVIDVTPEVDLDLGDEHAARTTETGGTDRAS